MPTRKEIESLVYLLSDPDPFVTEKVQNRLEELGEKAVPLLDEYRVNLTDKADRERINNIIHTLTFPSLESDFAEIVETGLVTRKLLERAIFILSRFGNPTLDAQSYYQKLDQFALMVAPEIRYNPDERHRMQHLLSFVFERLNFHGDTQNYHAPENCLMDQVIDRRKGLPISLSLVVIFIARRLDLPFFGINMPIHFMLSFAGEKEELLIDPFDKGAVVSYDQCYFFLKKNNVTPHPGHFQIASNIDIVIRYIRNLMHSYDQQNQPEKIEDLRKLLTIAEYYE